MSCSMGFMGDRNRPHSSVAFKTGAQIFRHGGVRVASTNTTVIGSHVIWLRFALKSASRSRCIARARSAK